MRASEIESFDDLATLGLPELTGWLRQGSLTWSSELDARKRLRAFNPATLFAHIPDEGAGVTLADELCVAFDGETQIPGEAAVLALEGWSLPHDGSVGAALLIQLAAELGASRLRDGLDTLINRPAPGSVELNIRLSGAIGIAACERLSRAVAEAVGVDARRAGLISADDAAKILVYVCRGRLDRLVTVAAAMRLPDRDWEGMKILAPLFRVHDRDEALRFLSEQSITAPQKAARDWVVEALSAFELPKPNPRRWRQRLAQTPGVAKTLQHIQNWIEQNKIQYPEVKTDNIVINKRKITVFNSKSDIDPNLDSTALRNVVNIEDRRVNGG